MSISKGDCQGIPRDSKGQALIFKQRKTKEKLLKRMLGLGDKVLYAYSLLSFLYSPSPFSSSPSFPFSLSSSLSFPSFSWFLFRYYSLVVTLVSFINLSICLIPILVLSSIPKFSLFAPTPFLSLCLALLSSL